MLDSPLQPQPAAPRPSPWALPLRLAVRNMRSGLDGFVVFLMSLALGVAVIGAVGQLAGALEAGLERQGRQIIGGDVTLVRMHARASEAERAAMAKVATGLSETATLRSMARLPDGSDSMLIELKSVDAAYPLVGRLDLRAGASLAAVLARGEIAVEPILLERLGLAVGDRVSIGAAKAVIGAVIDKEPDGLGDRLSYGPRVILGHATLEATGLIAPGSLVRWRYAMTLPGGGDPSGAGPAELTDARAALAAAMPESGYTVSDRRDPSPQIRRTLERLRQFLTLIGLTALIVGGVGIANAVSHFIDRRRRSIAAMRALGATGPVVVATFLAQILAMAVIGILVGLTVAATVPPALVAAFGDALPIPADAAMSWPGLLTAAGYGVLVALLFSLWPLGRAEQISPAVLFRDEVGDDTRLPPRRYVVLTAVIALALAAIAILSTDARLTALWFCLAVVVVFVAFVGLGQWVAWAARRAPRPASPELAVAIRSIGAPGGFARAVVLSLGLGLSLLVAVGLTDASLVRELQGKLPDDAPDYFMLDIKRTEIETVREIASRTATGAVVREAPMLRGRLVRLGDRAVEDIKAPPEAEWVLRGDRGITYAATLPEGSRMVAGEWWPVDYAGPPLVSFEADLARMLGVGIGDEVTVNVLGRNITARIASLRELDWDSLAINFVLVFSPNTLAGAPYNLLATVKLPPGTALSDEVSLARTLARALPTVTAIRLRDAIDAFAAVFEKVMLAVRVAGGVTLLAGALVLAGALATAQRRRVRDAVILKTLGATRARIIAAHALEYALLALVAAVIAVALGSVAAWAVLTFVIDVPFYFSAAAVLQTLAVALALVMGFGALGTWQVLRARPVAILRSE
ncbi:MAG: FtsX-like permease family protein [Hyphomicrobiaceae bacterium]|nr:FtsX-like permease family protein [Hyphomicrobiaceae bacterium]